MLTEKRRKELLKALRQSSSTITGTELASQFNVSRQVIVQDIAILRAAGEKIFSTPQGYLLLPVTQDKWAQEILACLHTREQIADEIGIIVDLGGRVLDVLVEHPVYGQLQGGLMIASRRDLNIFLAKLNKTGAVPLSALTEGSHLHTIEAPDQETMNEIAENLDKAGYLNK